jgi:hypothetical protein
MGHSGCTMAQIYAGKRSSRLVAYGMISESQMPNALEDLIRKHGVPNCLFSDNAKVQIGARVRDILRLCKIKDFQCETEHQNQNFVERKVGDVNREFSCRPVEIFEISGHVTQMRMCRTTTPHF